MNETQSSMQIKQPDVKIYQMRCSLSIVLVLESSEFSGEARDEFGLEYGRDAAENEVKSESQEMELSVSFSADLVSLPGPSVSCGPLTLGLVGV